MDIYRFLISGSGGQGVITMAILLAEAAVLHENRIAVQSQVYGPEARGGATRSDVIISDNPIRYPKVAQPNILVTLTSEACVKYLPLLRPGGTLITDSHLVKLPRAADAHHISLPLYETVMERLGKAVAFNIAVLGAVVTISGAVHLESLEKVLAGRFAPAFHKSNLTALHLGVELAQQHNAASQS